MICRLLTSLCCRQIPVNVKAAACSSANGSAITSLIRRMDSIRHQTITPTTGSSRYRTQRREQKPLKLVRIGGPGHSEHQHNSRFRHVCLAGFIGSIGASLGLDSEKKKEGQDEEDELVMAIKKGILHLDNGQHDEADTVLHEALQMAITAHNDKAVDYIYVILADNAMANLQPAKAESLYKEVLRRILAKDAKEDDESVIEISLQLATIYAERSDFENADEGFAFCIHKQKARVSAIDLSKELTEDQVNSLALYGMILDWYSKYCQLRKDYKLAVKYATEAFELSKRVSGDFHEQTLVLMSDLGVLTEQAGDLDKAIEILKQVVDLASSVNAEGLCTFFYNLGMCYIKKQEGHNANYCCHRAMKLADMHNRNRALALKARNCIFQSQDYMIENQLSKEE